MPRFLDLLPRPRRLPGGGFVTLVHSTGAERGAASRLAAVWQVAGALGDALARIVVARSEGGAGSSEWDAVRFVAAPGGRLAGAELERELALRTEEASRVVALTDPALDAWPESTRGLADAYAARVVGELGGRGVLLDGFGTVGGLVRPGLLLVARSRLGSPAPENGEADLHSFDLRALRRLRDLEIPAHRVTIELGSALGGWRRGRTSAEPVGPRVEIDRRALPATVEAGSDAVAEVEGWILALPPVGGLVLRCGPSFAPVPVDVERPDVAAAQPQLPTVTCGFRARLALRSLPPGRHPVTLERRDGRVLRDLGSVAVEERAARAVAPRSGDDARGTLSVERCDVEPTGGAPPWRLRIDGALEDADRVDSLRVLVGDRPILDVDPRSFAARDGASSGATFRVDAAVALAPGRATIGVAARRGQEVLASWTGELEVPAPARRPARLCCDDFDRLRRSPGGPVWGGVRLRGRVDGAPAGCEAVLREGGREAARERLGGDGSFELAAPLDAGREHEVDLVVERDGAVLVEAGPVVVTVRAGAISPGAERDLDTLREALGEAGDRLPGASSGELLREIALRSPETFPDLTQALGRIATRIRAARSRPSRLARADETSAQGSPLRVLWVSSEVPWSGHGGGVAQVSWLRELGRRHEITLAHPVHPGAEGLSDEVRPYVREILSTTRDWRDAPTPSPFGVPEARLRTFTPRFRAAVAAESSSGRYDLVQYESAGTYLHASRAAVPDLVTLYEVEAFGLVAGARGAGDSRPIGDLVAALHFETVLVPERFGALVPVSEPEARFLLPFLPDSTLRVSPLPVDVDELERLAGDAPPPAAPTFVFVGNFRHPPNGVAAFELVEETWPAIRRRLPGARLVLAGADAPLELAERARARGVECPGWVDDLERLLGGATALVAPIRTGAGMRVKLLEAMACGCPVVTTALGANGLGVLDGESYLRAESTAELADAASRLAGDPALRERLRSRGRALVAREHGPEVQAARREAIWRAVLAGAG